MSGARTTPSGSRTQTITVEEQSQPSDERQQPEALVLRLNRKKKRVSWKEGTVDNEFLGKKSSKKCCIFHKDKPFDDDSSDDDTDRRQDKPHRAHAHGEKGCCSSPKSNDSCNQPA